MSAPGPAHPFVDLAVKAEAILGEGTCWDSEKQVLYWVDILQKQLHIFDPARGRNSTYSLPDVTSAVVPTARGSLMLAMKRSLVEFWPEQNKFRIMAEAEDEPLHNRFNDGKCDPSGRFWVGSMDEEGKPDCGCLYCYSGYRLEPKLKPVSISNGLAWLQDCSKLFYIDTGCNTLCAYTLTGSDSQLGPRDLVFHNPFPDTHLDGMTIDEQGMLWIAVCGGGCIIRVNPDSGKIIQEVQLPVKLPTNCAFGGPEMEILYVTSARETLCPDELQQYPLSGSVLQVSNFGVRGVASIPAK